MLVEVLAQVASRVEGRECAARLFGAAETLRQQVSAPVPLVDRPGYARGTHWLMLLFRPGGPRPGQGAGR